MGKRLTFGVVIALALIADASAARVSRTQSGTAACPDKAWRVLVIGGELQPNSWCDEKAGAKERNKKVAEKKEREREEYDKKKEAEREKDAAEKKRREAEREAERVKREAERKEKEAKRKKKNDCRGVGSGADCQTENPGNGSHKGNEKKGH